MANIVQLKENGVITYPQTHINAVVGLSEQALQSKSVVLWSGSAKQGDRINLTESVNNFSILFMILDYGGGSPSGSFLPDETYPTAVAPSIYTSGGTTISVLKYVLQKVSNTQYIVSTGREVSGSNQGSGTGVTGSVKKIIGIR